jgi:molecular chaperone GrpE (heat shock protein)
MPENLNPELPLSLPEPVPAADTTRLADWKDALRRDFEQWLESVDEIPEESSATPPTDAPDLFSLHEQLAALGAESKRGNRRVAEVFSQWGDTMQRFETELGRLRAQLLEADAAQQAAKGLSRAHCLALVELLDRLLRIQAAFAKTPDTRWWERATRWRARWSDQHDALDIVVGHLDTLLQQEGVERLTTLDEPFNPATMVAVATEADRSRRHHTVIEEILPGYRRRDELLRPAQVKVSLNKESISP